jgi:hypothetical protein
MLNQVNSNINNKTKNINNFYSMRIKRDRAILYTMPEEPKIGAISTGAVQVTIEIEHGTVSLQWQRGEHGQNRLG